MSRVRDHMTFALRFTGGGYLLLWPLSGFEQTGLVFGATLLCPEPSAMTGWACSGGHPIALSAGLHLLGCSAAVLATGHFLGAGLCGLCRGAAPQMLARIKPRRRPRRRRFRPVSQPVTPRREFGLRRRVR